MLNSIIIVEQKDSAGTMFFEGEITIPSANELKNALINSLDKFNCLEKTQNRQMRYPFLLAAQ